ncbi:MAG: hypothetical protein ABFE07_29135 [Armatimonadia bacterium]
MPSVAEMLAQYLDEQSPAAAEPEKVAEASAPAAEPVDPMVEKISKELNLSAEELDAAEKALEESEKQAEAVKLADEATLLGRFMARGFIDEMKKQGGSLEMGGGGKVEQQAAAATPQDGSKVLAKVKAAVEKAHTSPNPDAVATMGVVRKIISTAKKVKAPVTAVETNQ